MSCLNTFSDKTWFNFQLTSCFCLPNRQFFSSVRGKGRRNNESLQNKSTLIGEVCLFNLTFFFSFSSTGEALLFFAISFFTAFSASSTFLFVVAETIVVRTACRRADIAIARVGPLTQGWALRDVVNWLPSCAFESFPFHLIHVSAIGFQPRSDNFLDLPKNPV